MAGRLRQGAGESFLAGRGFYKEIGNQGVASKDRPRTTDHGPRNTRNTRKSPISLGPRPASATRGEGNDFNGKCSQGRRLLFARQSLPDVAADRNVRAPILGLVEPVPLNGEAATRGEENCFMTSDVKVVPKVSGEWSGLTV